VVVILNKPGGQNIIGAQAAARSAPDGYTFYFATTAALVSNVYLFKQLPYDPVKDFDPVAFVATSPFGIMVPGASPIRSIDDFIAASKAAPDRLTLANEGPRTLGGMDGAPVQRAGLASATISFPMPRPASASRMRSVDGWMRSSSTSPRPRNTSSDGDLRLLATTSAGESRGGTPRPLCRKSCRLSTCRDGLPWSRPAGTPKAVIARLNRDINAALAEPELGREDFRRRADRGTPESRPSRWPISCATNIRDGSIDRQRDRASCPSERVEGRRSGTSALVRPPDWHPQNSAPTICSIFSAASMAPGETAGRVSGDNDARLRPSWP
jgi:hypothetical protein